jgi:hypothetical protein
LVEIARNAADRQKWTKEELARLSGKARPSLAAIAPHHRWCPPGSVAAQIEINKHGRAHWKAQKRTGDALTSQVSLEYKPWVR